jgi:DNA invertase Pin-like site-specific DNA recombinase
MKQAYIYSRWSDAKQSKGDSHERQMEIGLDWCSREIKHLGIPLCPLKCDNGFSAYKGEHVKRGSFGHFLAEIKKGNIEKDSILITENLDRISRQGPKDARVLIQQMTDHGVELHICNINIKLTHRWEDDQSKFIIVDCELSRAQRESKYKSDRIGRAWRNLKANACDKNHPDYGLAINSTGSPWEYVRRGKKITVSEQDTKTLIYIFQQAALHQGCRKIARKLNQHPDLYPMFNPYGLKPALKTPYSMSLVFAALRARSLIGEHQFLKDVNGELVEDGDPLTGGVYKPITIPQELWNEANAAMNRRKLVNKEFRPKTKKEKQNGLKNKVNRLPEKSSNLFSSIIFDYTPD